MGVDVNEPDWLGGTQRLDDRECNRVIASDCEGHHLGCVQLAIEGENLIDHSYEIECARNRRIADVSDSAHTERVYTGEGIKVEHVA
jgi:hypothetical protein